MISKLRLKNQKGFTMIELIVVIIVIIILLAVVISSYATIQRDQRNQDREQAINQIYEQLEAYYVSNSKYPTLSDMNNLNWVETNMKTLAISALKDPAGITDKFASKPVKDQYAYSVTSASGSSCDDIKISCAHYTLTATLEDSSQKTYVKTSLN